MATKNSINLSATTNGDGFSMAGGTTLRTLSITGGDVTITASGSAVITYPASTSTLATLALSETLTNKTIALGSNTISGTIAQFNTAVTDADFATLAGTEELDGKTLDSSVGKGTWTASGTWTLPAMTFGGDITMAENAGVVLDVILSADGKYSGIVQAGVAGATLAFGDLCYLDTSVPDWKLADANDTNSGTKKLGICVLAAASAAATTILVYGTVRADAVFPTFTAGQIFISETAGDVTSTAPVTTDVVVRVLGHALTGDAMFFNPDNFYYTHT